MMVFYSALLLPQDLNILRLALISIAIFGTDLFVIQAVSSYDCCSKVTAQLRHSPYLAELASHFGEPKPYGSIRDKVSQASAKELQTLKAKFSLAFATTKFDEFDQAGQVWSEFADATIQRALELAWNDTLKKHRLNLDPDITPGLFILGLGKLGGLDLNFSSDVDLIAFFNPEISPIPTSKGQAYICLLYTSPSPRDKRQSRMPSSA